MCSYPTWSPKCCQWPLGTSLRLWMQLQPLSDSPLSDISLSLGQKAGGQAAKPSIPANPSAPTTSCSLPALVEAAWSHCKAVGKGCCLTPWGGPFLPAPPTAVRAPLSRVAGLSTEQQLLHSVAPGPQTPGSQAAVLSALCRAAPGLSLFCCWGFFLCKNIPLAPPTPLLLAL